MKVSQNYLDRFGGLARLYGQAALPKLAGAKMAVLGIGGVGSWVAEALARSGVGEIHLFDLDDLCVSNINRQLHALDATIGQPKVEVMAQRLQQINPEGHFVPVSSFITLHNLAEQLNQNFDVIIDATDTVPVKAGIINWCKRAKVKLIVVGGAGGQLDARLINSQDLARVIQDPLLAKVRNVLRREHNFPRGGTKKFGVECIYSTEQLVYPQPDGSVCATKPGADAALNLNCAGGFGSASFVTGTFGLIAAQRALAKFLQL